jgi:hypothetical protein
LLELTTRLADLELPGRIGYDHGGHNAGKRLRATSHKRLEDLALMWLWSRIGVALGWL